jgi:hypothetical protein
MPALDTEAYNLNARFDMREKNSHVVRVSAFDGLQATQLEREFRTLEQRGGIPEGQAAAAPARLEYQADADLAVSGSTPATPDLGGQGVRRYVPNPKMGATQFPGLWAGGPVRLERGENGNLRCLQTLTRVRNAGQSWTVHGTTGLVTFGTAATADGALAQLKASRPRRETGKVMPTPYRTDWPEQGVLRLAWRHWTHESEAYLLAITAAQAAEVAAYHGVASADWKVLEWRFRVEEATNAGVFEMDCARKTVYTPASAADLKAQPHRVLPANRETLRAFGLKSEAKGEGYAFGRVYRWTDILPAARTFLEYPDDIALLWTVVDGLASAYPAYAGRVLNSVFQEGGRAWLYMVATSGTFAAGYAAGSFRPWWRVVEYRVEEQEDGLLAFVAHVERPEWSNRGTGPDTATEALGAMGGWGADLRETVPSVPRADAEALLAAAPAKTGYLAARRTATEAERGRADIGTDYLRVFAYTGSDKPANLPTATVATDASIEAPEIEERHETSQEGAGLVCRYYRVNPANFATLLATAKTLVCPSGKGYELRTSGVRAGENGDITVYAASTKYKQAQDAEWWGNYEDTMVGYADQYRRRKANVGDSWAGGATKQSDCPERDEMRIARTTTYVKATTSRGAAYGHCRTAGAQNPRVGQRGSRRWYAQYDLVDWTPWFEMPGTAVQSLVTLYAANGGPT